MIFTLCLSVMALLTCLCGVLLHAGLVTRGRTYYEWRMLCDGRRQPGRSLFDYGIVNNVALTLGIHPAIWLLPTRTGIEGNGIFFPEQVRRCHKSLHAGMAQSKLCQRASARVHALQSILVRMHAHMPQERMH